MRLSIKWAKHYVQTELNWSGAISGGDWYGKPLSVTLLQIEELLKNFPTRNVAKSIAIMAESLKPG